MKYRICDLIVASDYAPASFRSFRCGGQPELYIKKIPAPIPGEHPPSAVHPDFSVFRLPEGWLFETPQGEQLAVDGDYRKGRLYLPPDMPAGEARVTLLLRICIECRFIHRGVLSLHAACVIRDGRAVAFTGASGMGKSTRAAQWINALGARWLSGDRPGLCVAGGMAYGVPWDGKEQIFSPESAPVTAILEVRRSPFTRLRHLSTEQARRLLMQQCFVPMWDSDTAARAMALIQKAAGALPVYRLLCDQTELAAHQTCEILIRRPEHILPGAMDLKLRENLLFRQDQERTLAILPAAGDGRIRCVLSLNETAAFLLKNLRPPLCQEDLLALLESHYLVTPDRAEEDWETIKNTFLMYGIVKEEA